MARPSLPHSRRLVQAAAILTAVLVVLTLSQRFTAIAASLALSASANVNQRPAGEQTVPSGSPVTYTVLLTLQAPLDAPLTIQLAVSPQLANRTLECLGPGGEATALRLTDPPACRWTRPVPAGVYSFVLNGAATGTLLAPVPNALSLACVDRDAGLDCEDETGDDRLALIDSDGDAGTLSIGAGPPPGTGVGSNFGFALVVARDGVQ